MVEEPWRGGDVFSSDVTFSMIVIITLLIGIIILIAYFTKKWMDEDTLKTFGKKFLKFEKKERERLLKKYIKSKSDSEQTTARNIFFEDFKDISKETREEILEYLGDNIKAIKNPFQRKREIWDLLDIMDEYFNDIFPSVRNNMLLKMIEAKDFRIIKIIKNHLKEIPAEILNKAFIELCEDEEMVEILYDYDKSTCMDEKIKGDALRKYVEIWWINADVEILKKFLERGIQDKKLREDVMTILSLEEKKYKKI